jgi:hypothetical protein
LSIGNVITPFFKAEIWINNIFIQISAWGEMTNKGEKVHLVPFNKNSLKTNI